MILALVRLLGVFGLAGLGAFCLWDVIGNIRRGYTPSSNVFGGKSNAASRQSNPISFWVYIGLKLFAVAGAFLMIALYCAMALAA